MNRLFWKIFFSFWLSMVIIVTAFGWIHQRIERSTRGEPAGEQMEMVLRGRVETAAEILLTQSRRGGVEGVKRWLRRERFPRFSTVFVFDEHGQEILNRSFRNPDKKALEIGTPPNRMATNRFYALSTPDRNDRLYRVIAIDARRTPPGSLLSREGGLIRLTVAIAVSALICLLLARYLTRPIRRLSWAAREMGEGNLAARVSDQGDYPGDELGEMGAEFDRMAVQLEQSYRLQRQLLLDVSHELRSPLARLQVATELARKRAGQAAGTELDRIEKESEKLNELIGEILHLSRQQGDEQALSLEPVNLSELLLAVVEAAGIEADRLGCRIACEIGDSLQLDADPALLERAIENVLRNALAHTPENSQVTISAEREDDTIVIIISDQGPGVPESQLEDIFRPFYRVSQARERLSGGYGLGLAIARAGIERHGGQIMAENLQSGGLGVRIELPREPNH
jgi:two-component system sensor histidine kinase CpxA